MGGRRRWEGVGADVCISARISPKDSLRDGVLIIHAGAVMISGAPQLIKDAVRIIATFKTGAVGELTSGRIATYRRVQLRVLKNVELYLSQSEYIRELIHMGVEEYLSGDRIAAPELLKSTPRQGLGAAICTRQTRPDVALITTSMDTSLVGSCLGAS